MEIYADMVFFINLFMDMFILWILGVITNRKRKFLKILLGGLTMASLYCVLIFFVEYRLFLNIFASITIILLGVLIAYVPKNAKELFKLTAICHIIAFGIGGLGIALYYFSNIYDYFGNAISGSLSKFSIGILIISTAVFYLIIKLFQRWILRRVNLKQIFYPIKIFDGTMAVTLNALVDTGNTLHDPLSNAPVIVAEYKVIKDFLPESVKNLLNNNANFDMLQLGTLVEGGDFWGKFRMIPFSSIGRQNGLLLGFRPDKVEITHDKNIITLENSVIAIYNLCLTKDGTYQGLINPKLLNVEKLC